MWDKIKNFFKIVLYEMKRVTRNKVVITMLLLFSIAIVVFCTSVLRTQQNFPIAIYLESGDYANNKVIDLINENYEKDYIIYVNSDVEGFDLVYEGKACVFLSIPEDTKNNEVTLYYDASNYICNSIKNEISNLANKYAYATFVETLENCGISISKNILDEIEYEPVNLTEIETYHIPFSLELATGLAVVLMFGIAYSIARDNETSVSKSLSYVPIGLNTYMLSKILPYFILGLVQTAIILLIDKFLLSGIMFQASIVNITLFSSLFILSSILLGMLFSMLKSQISAIFCDIAVIVIPIFVVYFTFLDNLNFFAQFLLLALPGTPYALFLNSYMYNGIINWLYIGALAVQCVIYYLITYLIMKKRI